MAQTVDGDLLRQVHVCAHRVLLGGDAQIDGVQGRQFTGPGQLSLGTLLNEFASCCLQFSNLVRIISLGFPEEKQ